MPGAKVHLDLNTLDGLRTALQREHYSQDTLRETLHATTTAIWPREAPYFARKLASAPEHLATLIRLFFLGLEVEEDQATAAVSPSSVQGLAGMGLLSLSSSGVIATTRLTPFDRMLFFHDPWIADTTLIRRDHVMGVAPSTRTLANLTVRPTVGLSLDIGTGCGVQAFLAAGHSTRVIATDINARALDFAAINARLNQVSNVEFRLGDAFSPVNGLRFDLIVSNPPFVISPQSDFMFRDSGLQGHGFVESLVRQAPAHLANGGFVAILGDWTHDAEAHWSQPLQLWLKDGGSDSLILRFSTHDPLTYAAAWSRDLPIPEFGPELDRWLDSSSQLGIERISSGIIIVRRRSQSGNWMRAEESPARHLPVSGPHILRIFKVADQLQALDDDRFRAATLRPAPGLVIQETIVIDKEQRRADERTATLTKGIPFSVPVDDALAAVLRRLDAGSSVEDALGSLVGIGARQESEIMMSLRSLAGLGLLSMDGR